MAQRSALAASRSLGSIFAISAALAACFAFSAQAFGQPKPKPPGAAPPPAGLDGGAPPGTGTDMELDPDAKPTEPPPKEEKPLPAQDPDAWGVGGKEEEGKFAPQSKKKVEDDDQDKGPLKLGPPGAVGVDMVVGFGAMRDVHDDSNKTKILAISFIVGFQYRIGESLTLKARFPATNATIQGPKGPTDEYATSAVGNLEIGAQYAFGLTRRLRLPVDLAIDIPTAPGDLFGGGMSNIPVAQALVNQAAMFTRGWEENPLFASKRFGFRVGAGITYERYALRIAAGTRLDLMAKTGGNPAGPDLDGNALLLRKTTVAWVTTAQAFYDFFDGKLSPGLRAWLVVATAPVYSGPRDYSGAQFVLEPDVQGTFGLNASGSLAIRGLIGFIVPISGQLGAKKLGGQDSGRANGFRARAEFLF